MFAASLNNPKQDDVFTVAPNLLENPTFLSYYLKMLLTDVIPNYAVPVIKEGVADGSILTEYPEELASVIMLLCNVWLNPLLFAFTTEELIKRARLVNQLFEQFNLVILDPQMIAQFEAYNNIATKQ